MPLASFKRRFDRLTTLRRVVLLGPLLGLAVVIAGVLFGIKLAERQFDYIEDRVQRSLAYQYTVMTQSILFERTHSYMIQLSQLFQDDDADRSIALQLQLLQQSQRWLSGLSGALDPRVEKYDLEQRLTWLKGVIADAENASRDEPLPHHQAKFREISTLFNKIAGQTRVLVQQDLDALKDETVALIWQLFRMLLGLGVVLCAVSYAVAQLISRPILSLAHTVEALDQGNLEVTVPVRNRTDEIGKVAHAIERFKASLKHNQVLMHERDDLNRNLERNVEERTSELAIERERLARTTLPSGLMLPTPTKTFNRSQATSFSLLRRSIKAFLRSDRPCMIWPMARWMFRLSMSSAAHLPIS